MGSERAAAKKWPGVILNLTDHVPPELITENFITKRGVLNFPSLARRSGNAADLSAINDVIKAIKWPLKTLKDQSEYGGKGFVVKNTD